VAVCETALLRREAIAEDTIAFYFEKPADSAHQAGQNAVFTLVNSSETDSKGRQVALSRLRLRRMSPSS
jgi:hypothetical protein